MSKLTLIFALALFLIGYGCSSTEAERQMSPEETEPFEVSEVHFEQNATDGDVEVVFEVKGGDLGLAKLKVVGPDGRTVMDFSAPDTTTLGLRSFRFESPEPGDTASLKNGYPEGVYTFSATDTDGMRFGGEWALSHILPATVTFQNPEEEAEEVPIQGLEIAWSAVEGVAAYLLELEIEHENMDANVTAKLPASAQTFAVPEHFLLPDMEYKISVGTVSEDGNISYVETSFTTAAEEGVEDSEM